MKKTLKLIKNLVELETGVNDLSTKQRDQKTVNARVIFYVLAREFTLKSVEKVSLQKIGATVKRDHSTVLHSCKIIHAQWLLTPSAFRDDLDALENLRETIINELKNSETPVNKDHIYRIFKKRNVSLKNRVKELREQLNTLKKEVKRLKKEEAILW